MSGPHGLAKVRPGLRVLLLASLRQHTGNRITSERLCRALLAAPSASATTGRVGKVFALDVHAVKDRAELARILVQLRIDLVVGVHAFRAGRLLVDCGVPCVIVLGGTDMNANTQVAHKLAVMRRALGQARAVVAFNKQLHAALLRCAPSTKSKAFIVPQAVTPVGDGALSVAATEEKKGGALGSARGPPATAVASDWSVLLTQTTGASKPAPVAESALRQRLDLRAGEHLLLLPAGLRPVKDVLFAVRAVLAWRARGARAVLRLVGPVLDQSYAQRVKETLETLRQEHSDPRGVLYCGTLPRRELLAAMRMSTAVLNTSSSEGMCNSLLEAMFLGRPVLARRNEGNGAVVRHGVDGILFDTPEELVAVAARLVAGTDGTRPPFKVAVSGTAADADHDFIAMGRAARDKITAEFSSQEEARRYAEVLLFAMGPDGCQAADLRTRDQEFLGMHPSVATCSDALYELDVYGTLKDKQWRGPYAWLCEQVTRSHRVFLAAVPPRELPQRPGLNPVWWSIGHVAFAFDAMVAHPLGLPTPGVLCPAASGASSATVLRSLAHTVFDSMRVGRAERWHMTETGQSLNAAPYLCQMVDMALDVLSRYKESDWVHPVPGYLVLYATVHMLWHTEDMTHTRNMNSLPCPPVNWGAATEEKQEPQQRMTQAASSTPRGAQADALEEKEEEEEDGKKEAEEELGATMKDDAAAPTPEDVYVPGGVYYLGAEAGENTAMVFDNEKWAHPVKVRPFRISKHCVTNEEFAAFVAAGGYTRPELWGFEGARWLKTSGARHPYKWIAAATSAASVQQDSGGAGDAARGTSPSLASSGWLLQWFDEQIALPPWWPVSHVTWFEAKAFCSWSGRRLPTEAEWEMACCGVPDAQGGVQPHKPAGRLLPWQPRAGAQVGRIPAIPPRRANVGLCRRQLIRVDALPESDSAWGVRQMIGNVWEWTESTLYPFPGYVMDYPYREQSAPRFGTEKVARGGCFATPKLLMQLRGGQRRSFYEPGGRRELAVGFRTCAL